MLNLQSAEDLACDASRQAAHVLLGHWGLLNLVQSDPTGLLKLILLKWQRCAEASAEEVAEKLLYCQANETPDIIKPPYGVESEITFNSQFEKLEREHA